MFDAWKPQLDALNGDPGRPKYEQLKKLLMSDIAAGRLQPGRALPSEQRLAESLSIARSTVRQAMADLERGGLIVRVHGKGTFIHDQARERMDRRRDLFALIVPETRVGFYPSLLRSFEDAAGRLHNQVIVCNSNNDVERQGNAILQLIDQDVAGVAIVPTTAPPTPAYQIRQLQKRGIPVVFCARSVEGVRAPLVAIPFEEVGRRAGEMILRAGHRRLAYFGIHRSKAAIAYEQGLRQALNGAAGRSAELHAFYGASPVPDVAAHEQEISESLDRMLDLPQPPTAVFASFDSVAELIYVLLGRRGIRVPEEISLVGFGGTERHGAMGRRVTSVTVDEVAMGVRAAELLDRMRRGELPLEHDAVDRVSLGSVAGETLIAIRETDKRPAVTAALRRAR